MAITPLGHNAYQFEPVAGSSTMGRVAAAGQPDKPELLTEPCQTCASRRYVDQSNDSSVSFQTPTKLAPSEAALAVAAHENEHVVNNRERAEQEDMVARSTVTISYDVCPECGRIYVAGGKTTTTFTPKQQTMDSESEGPGGKVNTFA
ncbi:MAG: hypothetical protein K4571_00295 [Deltaproteobacteria bacterium]